MDPPSNFFCSITQDLMIDPVCTADGQTYERAAITQWLQDHNTSPQTNLTLAHRQLTPIPALRSAIEEWRETSLKCLPRSAIQYTPENLIGRGSFKSVYRGMLALPRNQNIQVAVLELPRGSLGAEVDTFLELGRHPRLVRFFGQCEFESKQLLVTELAPMGSLAGALEGIKEAITLPHVLTICQQMCAGMEAMAAHGVVHRDLAIRNVLLFGFDPANVALTSVKVSDYGLSVHTSSKTHVTVPGTELPIRYMPPEALQRRWFSEKSDVWAFGVAVWELLTLGTLPYFKLNSDDSVLEHVCGGGRLARGDCELPCPNPLWEVLERCWAERAADRPSFAELSIELGLVASGMGGQGGGQRAGGVMDRILGTLGRVYRGVVGSSNGVPVHGAAAEQEAERQQLVQQLEAAQQAQREAEQRAEQQAEQRAQLEAAQQQAEQRAQLEAAQQAQREAEQRAEQQAGAQPPASQSHTAPRPRREAPVPVTETPALFSQGTVVQAHLQQTRVGHRYDWYDAMVCWVGQLPDQQGTWYGLECWQPPYNGQGTDGLYVARGHREQRLFSCEHLAGFFAKETQLRPHPDFGAPAPAPAPAPALEAPPEPASATAPEGSFPDGYKRFETVPELHSVVLVKVPGLALPVRGLLAWVGELAGAAYAGVELFEPYSDARGKPLARAVGNSDGTVPSELGPVQRLFECDPGHGALVPAAMLFQDPEPAPEEPPGDEPLPPQEPVQLNSIVLVALQHPVATEVRARVAWVGQLPDKEGTWLGVELFDPWDPSRRRFLGDTNGRYYNPTSFKYEQLFHCELLSGLFITLAAAKLDPDFESPAH